MFDNDVLEKEAIKELIISAVDARKKAYTLYSDYMVGAALLTNEGRIYTGCNIENTSYGATICAERTAFVKAVSEGKRKFSAIAIVGGKKDEEISSFAYPCGMCRQVMSEFTTPDSFYIIVAKSVEEYQVYSLEQLLPHSFQQ